MNAHYTEPAGSMDGAGCRWSGTGSPNCVQYYSGVATFTGTLYGDERYELDTSYSTDGKILYEGAAFFTGGVQGCGKGSYILDGKGYIDMKKYDPVTNSAPGFNTWSYRPGSGTGGLTNLVSGSGVNHWRIYFSGAVAAIRAEEGVGDFTGTIRCRK